MNPAPPVTRTRTAVRYRLAPSARQRSLGRLVAPGAFCVQREEFMAQVETRNRATSSEGSRKEVRARIEQEGVEFVLLWFTDIEGHLKSFAVTPSEIEDALDDGMGFDGSSITGFNAIEESDMVAIPDPETFQLMPWKEGE